MAELSCLNRTPKAYLKAIRPLHINYQKWNSCGQFLEEEQVFLPYSNCGSLRCTVHYGLPLLRDSVLAKELQDSWPILPFMQSGGRYENILGASKTPQQKLLAKGT